jgi:triphosphoribosyl-dephospho-CoA synthase
LRENVSLFDVFKIASDYDLVCSEWVNGYPVTFDEAYQYLIRQVKQTTDPNVAVVHTFLNVLAKHPDSFIARKVDLEKAKEVSVKAETVLKLGGLETAAGRSNLCELDKMLRGSDNLLNPGTTADVVAAALALLVLGGYRP